MPLDSLQIELQEKYIVYISQIHRSKTAFNIVAILTTIFDILILFVTLVAEIKSNTTSSSNQKIRKRHQCSNCHEFEHSKRNYPLLKDSFTPLPTPRQSDRLQPDDKLESDEESANHDMTEIDHCDDDDEKEVEFLWSRWTTIDLTNETVTSSYVIGTFQFNFAMLALGKCW